LSVVDATTNESSFAAVTVATDEVTTQNLTRAVGSPDAFFSGEADNERFQFGRDTGPARQVRNLELSNLRAMSRLYRARMVSGLATQATC
jgi:hypothetical protein